MKTEKYIVEIEMPDGDNASPLWVCDVLQSDADIEDEGRWKISVKDNWKPSDEQMEALKEACDEHWEPDGLHPLYTLYQNLKKLKE